MKYNITQISNKMDSLKNLSYDEIELSKTEEVIFEIEPKIEPEIDLRIGYCGSINDNIYPFTFESVKRAEREILDSRQNNRKYLPFSGDAEFCNVAQEILFGQVSSDILTIQTLGATGALFLAIKLFMLSRKHETILTTSINYNYSDFLIQDETPTVYIPDITWENHSKILRRYKIDYKTYRYYDKNKMGLDYEGLKEDLLKAFEGSVIIFHLCGHNPTGADITLIQWFEIAEIAVKRKLLILFDAAYHGLASGCLRTDAEPIKIFYDQGIEFMVAQTFSKNMGLYGERIGALHLVPKYSEKEEDQCNPDFKKELWHLENIIRTTYSDPPIHGSKIVVKIWNDSSLRISWERELQAVVNRIKGCRQKFYKQLRTSDFSYIITNRGFYSIINLTKEQREILCEKFGIYLKGERINFAGLNDGDLTYLTKALNDVMDINN